MRVIRKARLMQSIADSLRREGNIIGFVPTMGAFHKGHLSLMERSAKECDITIVSIFVNKLQFGHNEDFNKYPQQFKKDKALAESAGVDYLFAPAHEEMYSADFSSFVDVKGITENLCGASRPGHFKGVATIVAKLFNIVKPHKAFFGEKDYQQLVAIKRMVADLNFDIKICGHKIIREKDGLAMSSRNAYLNEEERKKATILYQSLLEGREYFRSGEKNAFKIIENAVKLIKEEGFEIDYVKIVDIDTLQDIKKINYPALMAVAARIGNTRLIDNIVLKK